MQREYSDLNVSEFWPVKNPCLLKNKMKSQWVEYHWKVLLIVQRVSLADLMWLKSNVLMSTDLRQRLPTNTITNCRFSQYKPMTEHAQLGCRWIQRVSMYLMLHISLASADERKGVGLIILASPHLVLPLLLLHTFSTNSYSCIKEKQS